MLPAREQDAGAVVERTKADADRMADAAFMSCIGRVINSQVPG